MAYPLSNGGFQVQMLSPLWRKALIQRRSADLSRTATKSGPQNHALYRS